MKKLSIIIPCYNEAGNLHRLYEKLEAIIDDEIEVIIVNNGSTDNSEEIISKESSKRNLIKFISLKENLGYGHGIMQGVMVSTGQVISWTHADLQTDPKDIIDGYQMYIKNPNHKFSVLKGKRIGRNLFDSFFTFSMSLLSSFLMGVKLSDINAQPKMFHRSFLDKIKNFPNDFSLDLYFLYQAKVNDLEIIEFPVYFRERLFGESKGGGSLRGKVKLINRTFKYILRLRKKVI